MCLLNKLYKSIHIAFLIPGIEYNFVNNEYIMTKNIAHFWYLIYNQKSFVKKYRIKKPYQGTNHERKPQSFRLETKLIICWWNVANHLIKYRNWSKYVLIALLIYTKILMSKEFHVQQSIDNDRKGMVRFLWPLLKA